MTLRWEGLSVEIPGRVLLPPTDLELAAGDSVAVIGPSGAGKTSVLSTVAALMPPSHGRVTLDGQDVNHVPRTHIGVVTQPVLLASTLTVAENVALPLQAAGVPRREVQQRVFVLLERLGLAGADQRLPSRLSGGQRQRVAVARAVASAPKLIVADEPTSELDHDSRERAIAVLLQATEVGSILVMSTHDPSVAEACHHVVDLTAVGVPSAT